MGSDQKLASYCHLFCVTHFNNNNQLFVITGTNSSCVRVSCDALLSLLSPDTLEDAPHLVPVARVVGEVLECDVLSHVLAKVVILGQLAERREHFTDWSACKHEDINKQCSHTSKLFLPGSV